MINGLRMKREKHHSLGITITKEEKDLYNKNFKSLKKEIEVDIRKWKDLPCSWTGRINVVKMTVLPKAIYKFNQYPSKSQQNSSQTSKE